MGLQTGKQIFHAFFTEDIRLVILDHTNSKMARIRSKIGVNNRDKATYKDVTIIELDAVYAILIVGGARNDNHLNTNDMFRDDFGANFYR